MSNHYASAPPIPGQHTVCAMVMKMPGVALKALDQFHMTNRASRQQFFFLNYLEPDPDINEASFLPMSVLGRVRTGDWEGMLIFQRFLPL